MASTEMDMVGVSPPLAPANPRFSIERPPPNFQRRSLRRQRRNG